MSKILSFLTEVRVELGKITWPKRDEFLGSTIIVCILIAFFALILGGMDSAFSLLLKKIFS